MSTVLPAIIAAITSVGVTVASLLLGERIQRRRDAVRERHEINASHLNPLRLHLEENHVRLSGTLARLDSGSGIAAAMLSVEDPAQISSKDMAWFTGTGCALLTGVYQTACLFAHLKKVRDDLPYLRLTTADDTELAALLFQVQRGYLQNAGVYYVLQPSMGEAMWLPAEKRLLTYWEFCERLTDPCWRMWFDRLVQFQLDTAQGRHEARTRQVLAAVERLSDFLDRCVGGGHSIAARSRSEAAGRIDASSSPGGGERRSAWTHRP